MVSLMANRLGPGWRQENGLAPEPNPGSKPYRDSDGTAHIPNALTVPPELILPIRRRRGGVSHGLDSRRTRAEDTLWKTCVWPVEKLLRTRLDEIFLGAGLAPKVTRPGAVCTLLRVSLRLIPCAGGVRSAVLSVQTSTP